MTTSSSTTSYALKRYKLSIDNIQVGEFSSFLLAVRAYLQYPHNSGYILDSLPDEKIVWQ